MSRRKEAADTTPEDLQAVHKLTEWLRTKEPLSVEEQKRRHHAHFRQAMNGMQQGASYGEASGYRGVAFASTDSDVARQQIRDADNDLRRQTEIVRDAISHHLENGVYPAPHYPWRIAVILRKIKEYTLEYEFLEAYASVAGDDANHSFSERAVKARKLAEKHQR